MNDHHLYLTRQSRLPLMPGKISENHFYLLIEVSPIHSEKVINALRDFLVMGYPRREACERNRVSQGYFSGALGRIQRTHQMVSKLIPFYISETSISYTG
ncbi:adhesin biosynthesis transcription regulatory family protein [Edwardsiella tarda]|uniref:Adhesin biosynthesis transcription regulatory family protein n=1 Tax=Edwardsiella tarda ATCC 15947 = NBRC 105688 TaxID=667121 RepID=A0AC61TMV7_EDWTA|nr:adhesin biosynthesis transcription regulatory family protein [Edwardsiella tarda]UAL58218.1 adhesin biosynthesis transcription regulatory family protein [Edwardsiella tarda]UCQ02049.1 adhesin biosynthesis transcription regulatory family protein [Edwardsiella tarda ATCC 15947 = NBRC 105688]